MGGAHNKVIAVTRIAPGSLGEHASLSNAGSVVSDSKSESAADRGILHLGQLIGNQVSLSMAAADSVHQIQRFGEEREDPLDNSRNTLFHSFNQQMIF